MQNVASLPVMLLLFVSCKLGRCREKAIVLVCAGHQHSLLCECLVLLLQGCVSAFALTCLSHPVSKRHKIFTGSSLKDSATRILVFFSQKFERVTPFESVK